MGKSADPGLRCISIIQSRRPIGGFLHPPSVAGSEVERWHIAYFNLLEYLPPTAVPMSQSVKAIDPGGGGLG